MDKLRRLYNRLKANGGTDTATFEEWVKNRTPEDYTIISEDYPASNPFENQQEYEDLLKLYNPDIKKTSSPKPIESKVTAEEKTIPDTQVNTPPQTVVKDTPVVETNGKVTQDVTLPDVKPLHIKKAEFGLGYEKQSLVAPEIKESEIFTETPKFGEEPSNVKQVLTNKPVTPSLLKAPITPSTPVTPSDYIEKSPFGKAEFGLGYKETVEEMRQKALMQQKAKNEERAKLFTEMGKTAGDFAEGSEYDLGLKVSKALIGHEEGKPNPELETLFVNTEPTEDVVNEIGKVKPFGAALYKMYMDNDKDGIGEQIRLHGEITVNNALNEFVKEAKSAQIDRAYKKYYDTEQALVAYKEEKDLRQKALKKLERKPLSWGEYAIRQLIDPTQPLRDKIFREDENNVAALKKKLESKEPLSITEKQVLETLTGERISSNIFGIMPSTELQKLQYLNDPNPQKQLPKDVELDLMVNNPDFKLNVWNETDLRQFSANNPEKSQTVENRKQY